MPFAETLLATLDVAGVIVFAASGALAAARQSMDIFGLTVIAVITAVGGGTVRDLTLGSVPVFWVDADFYIILAVATAVAVYFGERFVASRQTALTWLDAAGLALFAAVGAEKALAIGTGAVIASMMGVVTAVFGGVIRDVICNEVPLILRHEIYATAAFVAATVVVTADAIGAGSTAALLAGTAAGFVTRAVAIVFHLSLPATRAQRRDG